jgi:hypothetical protein
VILVCGSGTEREKASGEIVDRGRRPPRVARGSVPTAETGGIEYQSRRSLADRPVVAERSLLAGVGVERRGRLIRNVDSFNRGEMSWEEAKQHAKAR